MSDSQIREQIEFYFSDRNFSKDRFMKTETERNFGGWLAIDTLLRFNMLVDILRKAGVAYDKRVDKIAEVCRYSSRVEVDSLGLKIRRHPSLPQVQFKPGMAKWKY